MQGSVWMIAHKVETFVCKRHAARRVFGEDRERGVNQAAATPQTPQTIIGLSNKCLWGNDAKEQATLKEALVGFPRDPFIAQYIT